MAWLCFDRTGDSVLLRWDGLGVVLLFRGELPLGLGGDRGYILTQQQNGYRLLVDYQAPSVFADDFYDLTLTPTSETGGSFSGNLHYENQDHPVAGDYYILP